MTITEPATMITDYMLAGLCVWFGLRLAREATRLEQRSIRLFAWAMATTAVGAVAGGTSHGFRAMLSPGADALLWKLTVYSIGLTTFLFLAAAAHASLRGRGRTAVVALASVQLLAYGAWMVSHDGFQYVIYDYVPAMLVVALIQLIDWRRNPASARWIVAGIALSFAGAAGQQAGIGVSPDFNHNDVYHLVQMVATVALYRGARAMRDRAA